MFAKYCKTTIIFIVWNVRTVNKNNSKAIRRHRFPRNRQKRVNKHANSQYYI